MKHIQRCIKALQVLQGARNQLYKVEIQYIINVLQAALDENTEDEANERYELLLSIYNAFVKKAGRLAEALEESNSLNVNWVSVSEPDMLIHLSEYKTVIKQSGEALSAYRGETDETNT